MQERDRARAIALKEEEAADEECLSGLIGLVRAASRHSESEMASDAGTVGSDSVAPFLDVVRALEDGSVVARQAAVTIASAFRCVSL